MRQKAFKKGALKYYAIQCDKIEQILLLTTHQQIQQPHASHCHLWSVKMHLHGLVSLKMQLCHDLFIQYPINER